MDSNSKTKSLLFDVFIILQKRLMSAKECAHIKVRCVEYLSNGCRSITFISLKRWILKQLSLRYPTNESFELFLNIYRDYENKKLLSQYSYFVFHLPPAGSDFSFPQGYCKSDEEDFFLF